MAHQNNHVESMPKAYIFRGQTDIGSFPVNDNTSSTKSRKTLIGCLIAFGLVGIVLAWRLG